MAFDYVSKWVEEISSQKADGKTAIKFLKKNIFTRFGTPRVLISDEVFLQFTVRESLRALWC